MPSMPFLFHRRLYVLCIILTGVICFGLFELQNHLSDPSVVDEKEIGNNYGNDITTVAANEAMDGRTRTDFLDSLPNSSSSTTSDAERTGQSTVSTSFVMTTTDTTSHVPSRQPSMALQKPSQNPSRIITKDSMKPHTNASIITSLAQNHTIQTTRFSFKHDSFLSSMFQGNTNTSLTSFVNNYCMLQSAEWFPSTPETNWYQRATYLVLAGTLEAGIPSITKRLLQSYPQQLQQTNHSSFFLDKNFRHFLTQQPIPTSTTSISALMTSSTTTMAKPRVTSARQYLYAANNPLNQLVKDNQNIKLLDSSTGYLFWSSSVPMNLICSCPWVKIIILLRNPVDRLWAHYQSAVQLGLRLSLESWIEKDWKLLQHTWNSNTTSSALESWSQYLKLIRGDAPLGRGLYEIQLLQWIRVLSQTNKWNDVLILNYDDWKQAPQQIWQRIVEFSNLSPLEDPNSNNSNIDNGENFSSPSLTTWMVSSKRFVKSNATMASAASRPRGSGSSATTMTTVTTTLDAALREKLIQYYKPHNKRLYRLLGWDAVWDR